MVVDRGALIGSTSFPDPRVVTVTFTEALQRHIQAPPQRVVAGTVGDVLDAAFATLPKLRSYVLDDQGALRKHMAVFVNGATIRDRAALSDPVPDGAEVHVLQALSGG